MRLRITLHARQEMGQHMAPLLGALALAAFLLAPIAVVAAGRAGLAPRAWSTCVALGALFLSGGAQAQELNGVALRFLQRHGVPCLLVVKVGSPCDMGEVATCQDGREWALLWLEDEIAFVHPQTREPYKWDRQIYLSHPELFSGSTPTDEHQILVGNDRWP
jgi:hypothetical protein